MPELSKLQQMLFRTRRKKGASFGLRFIFHAVFVAVLLGVLFGSFRNQFGELFATYEPPRRPSAIVSVSPNSGPPPAGLRVVSPTANDSTQPSATPQVIGLRGNSPGALVGPKVVGPNSGSQPAPTGPAVIEVGSNPIKAPAGPTVVTLGNSPIRAPADLIPAKNIQVVDGDTIHLDGQSYRLVGIDTPESGALAKCQSERDLAARATGRLRELVSGADVKLVRVACSCPPGTEGTQVCNHGRFCGALTSAGRDVGQILIGEGLAHSYSCGATQCPPRRKWC